MSKETKYTSIYSIFYVLVGWTQKANTPSEITGCTFVYIKEKQCQYITALSNMPQDFRQFKVQANVFSTPPLSKPPQPYKHQQLALGSVVYF